MSTQAHAKVKCTSLVVHGAAGRVGARICALAADDTTFTLVAAIEHATSQAVGAFAVPARSAHLPLRITGAPPAALRVDAVIDFSSDEGARAALDIALAARAGLLVGTTALAESTLASLRAGSAKIPVIVAANTSLGVAVLASAAAAVARSLGPEYQISIVEAHHARKKDAPSGTALRLARAVESAGARVDPAQIVSQRGGDVIGEHTLRFAGPGEYLELTHRATNRDVFALGALRAAKWLHGREPGWFTIEDVVGLPRS